MDVFLFQSTISNSGDPKLSKTSSVLHSIPTNCNLAGLKKLVREHESNSCLYIPVSGFYWLRKGSKQLVQLHTDADLSYCKEEYRDARKGTLSSIRIACATIKPEYAGKGICKTKQLFCCFCNSHGTQAQFSHKQIFQ